MKPEFSAVQTENGITIKGRHYKFFWNNKDGKLSKLSVFDGINWIDNILSHHVGHNWNLPLKKLSIGEKDDNRISLEATYETAEWELICKYEIFRRGYIVCELSIEAMKDEVKAEPLFIGMDLDKSVFAHAYIVKDAEPNESARSFRAISVDFSTDIRPVTNSINFLLESVVDGMKTAGCEKFSQVKDNSHFYGWKLTCGQNQYPYPCGFKYKNRWCLTVTALNNLPNPVRGQRIYTWYGVNPPYPTENILDEMAEYGCSILHLHNWNKYISGGEPCDEKRLRTVVDYAHNLGIKVLFYCQPYLISINAPFHNEYKACRTECLGIWDAMQNTQIINYEPNYDWDSDELCLRSEKAYKFIYDTILESLDRYGFDGLYMDYCWPAQGLCNDISHNHQRGLYNFYDYLKLLRELRMAVGPNRIMIGHGGGYLVSSDFVDAFDACLTGEAQGEFSPVVIGQQFGTVPTLWGMHRRKQDLFRSHNAIEAFIREGMVPHVGVGIMGTSVIATLDPAHHKELIALWQMWRAFPVDKAIFYNYLTEKVVELDNDEIFYSLYKTDENQILLLLVNAGGPKSLGGCSANVNVKIDIEKLNIPKKMKCWRMKGNTYDTFRIEEIGSIENAFISVPEIGIHEFIGFILTPEKPPEELSNLQHHLEGRWNRLPILLKNKEKRLKEFDRLIDYYATLPNAKLKMDYKIFMQGRVAE